MMNFVNPQNISKGISHLKNKNPQIASQLDSAFENARNATNPAQVVNICKSALANTPLASRFDDPEINNMLNSLCKQSKETAIPQVLKIAGQMGIMNKILGFFGGKLFG